MVVLIRKLFEKDAYNINTPCITNGLPNCKEYF